MLSDIEEPSNTAAASRGSPFLAHVSILVARCCCPCSLSLPYPTNPVETPVFSSINSSLAKRHYRAVKRSDSASAYKLAEDIRLQRLSAQLKQSALKPRALTDKEEWERKQAGFETDDDEEEEEDGATKEAEGGMELEGQSAAASTSAAAGADKAGEDAKEEGEKISTSGPRMSRREAYRSSKGFTVKQTPKTHFTARGEKKRMGCKPHRRR